jgi:hypothetical protein
MGVGIPMWTNDCDTKRAEKQGTALYLDGRACLLADTAMRGGDRR